jgi:hypothetical protein
MERQRPAAVSGSLDPERVCPGFDGRTSDAQIAGGLNTRSLIHADSPYSSDWEFGNTVFSERGTAVVDRDLLSLDGGISRAAVALRNRKGGERAYHRCAENELLEIHVEYSFRRGLLGTVEMLSATVSLGNKNAPAGILS